ncbi:LysR family transcriptional regulator [Pseudoalteromonas sp. S1609]|jgi:DNA-binding transcriptional LysR family regulator|uniref:LysR family transcriptional regulator n=1 Tax=Pseudoalteromonas sp. S1609 TaxID=579505 RepID=UPI00110BC2D9|nr:LysR family transcriptional regulator [Pseudoalteromonas sp. S1609]TMP70175.1 LysR family transcriptional regulator [Pseudoalteromonas sp. S1609]|tara:strand:+ start:1819 stop:2730 length:912 start_codon:yes stop_codon:yes gene_type:complete
MDTNGIRLFIKVAELLNISAAGDQLGLAPSVASARLSKLEVQLGADLFHRSTRRVSLSIEGTEFLPYAKEIIAQEDAAFSALGKGSSEVSGTLRFAASSTFAQRFVAPFLPEFLNKYPKVNVELSLSDTQVNLIQGGFDLALRNYTAQDSSLIGRKLANDTRVLCASPEYLKNRGTPKHPDDLNSHQLLIFMNAKSKKLTSSQNLSTYYFPPQTSQSRIMCDDGAAMRIAAESGAGICMSSLWSIYKELEKGTLVRVLPDYIVDDEAAVWLVYPKSNVLTPKVRVFIDFLVDKIGSPPVWSTN